MESTRRDLSTLALVLAALTAGALVLYAAVGARGTDQYWYLADAETLAAGRAATSNTLFPMGVLRHAGTDPYTPAFYHDGPLLRLVAALHAHLPFSVYAIWIALNVVCIALTLLVVALWLRRHASPSVARWTTAFAVIAPISFWQSANVLRETWFGALSALALALFFLVPPRARLPAEFALGAVLALGAFSHPMYLVLLVLLALWRTGEWLGERRAGRLVAILPSVLAIAAVALLDQRWFPTSAPPSIWQTVSSNVPGFSNMAWHFSDVQTTLDAKLLFAKLVEALRVQFAVPMRWPIYLPLNAAMLAWVLLALRRARNPAMPGAPPATGRGTAPGSVPEMQALLVLGVFLGLYVAMVVLQKPHMRIQQLVAPAAFILVGHALHAFVPSRLLAPLLVPVLVGCVAVSAAMSDRLRDEALVEAADQRTLAAAFADIGPDDRVLFVDVLEHDPMSYVLRPTRALFVRRSLITEAAARDAVARFGPTVLVTRDDEVPYGLDAPGTGVPIETPSYGAMRLRRVRSGA